MPRRTLKNITVFASLSAIERHAIEAKCRWRRYQPGEYVFQAGSSGVETFFLIEGELDVRGVGDLGREVQFASLLPGDSVGEMAAIDRHARSASVVAKTDCLIAVLGADDFVDILQQHSTVGFALLAKLAAIVRTGDARILDQGLHEAKSRVYDRLAQLAEPMPQSPGLWAIRPLPSLSEISRHAGATREQVAEALIQLYPTGIVERRDNSLYVLDLDAFRALTN